MNVKKFYKKFSKAKADYDFITEANCIAEAIQFLKSNSQNITDTEKNTLIEMSRHIDLLPYTALFSIHKRDMTLAQKYIHAIILYAPNILKNANFFYIHYMLGMINYEIGDYEKALNYINIYNQARQKLEYGEDEIAIFYLSNIFAITRNIKAAKAGYEKCLSMKKSFKEAAANLMAINSILNGSAEQKIQIQKYINDNSLTNVDENDKAACFNIPIFINARDRVGVMKKLIDWLLDAGYTNIIILDNGSTYQPLLDYYATFKNDSRIKIVYYKQNFGYKSIWKSGILEFFDIKTPYVYTDPDVVPIDSCPKNVVQRLLKILKARPFIKKVGLGLVYDDITFFNKEKIQAAQSNFYNNTCVEKNIHYAQVDTTFALYCNCRHYNLRFSMRTLGNLMAKHLPWYFDYNNLPEDEQYYMDHSDNSSSTNEAVKKK